MFTRNYSFHNDPEYRSLREQFDNNQEGEVPIWGPLKVVSRPGVHSQLALEYTVTEETPVGNVSSLTLRKGSSDPARYDNRLQTPVNQGVDITGYLHPQDAVIEVHIAIRYRYVGPGSSYYGVRQEVLTLPWGNMIANMGWARAGRETDLVKNWFYLYDRFIPHFLEIDYYSDEKAYDPRFNVRLDGVPFINRGTNMQFDPNQTVRTYYGLRQAQLVGSKPHDRAVLIQAHMAGTFLDDNPVSNRSWLYGVPLGTVAFVDMYPHLPESSAVKQWYDQNILPEDSNFLYQSGGGGVLIPWKALKDEAPETTYPTYSHVTTVEFDRFLKSVEGVTLNGSGATGHYSVESDPSHTWRLLDQPYEIIKKDPPTNEQVHVRSRFTAPGQYLYGFTITYTETGRITDADPIEFEPPDREGIPPRDWHDETKLYRAFTYNRVMIRHPEMAPLMYGTRVFNPLTNNEVTVKRYREYLVMEDSGPFLVYFNRRFTVEEAMSPLPVATKEEFEAARAQDTRHMAWTGIEIYNKDRNLVYPVYEVTFGNETFSAYLEEFNNGSVTLVGPAALSDQLPTGVFQVQVSSGGRPLFAGRVVRISGKPYANVRRLELEVLPLTKYFDVEMSAIDMSDEEFPPEEGVYIHKLLQKTGFSGRIYQMPGVQFRNTAFWGDPEHGPGMVEEEVLDRYWNDQSGTVLAEIQNLLHANMLDIYDMPDGNLLIAPIIPKPDLTLQEILENEALIYCVDEEGNYVNEARMDVSNVNLALDEGFAEVEIEGYSNEVQLDVIPSYAPFVQGVGGQQRQTSYHDQSLGAFQIDSETTWGKIMPFPFRVLEAGSARYRPVPRQWFLDLEMAVGDDAIEIETIDRWGIGSRWVEYAYIYWSRLQDLTSVPNHTVTSSNISELASTLGIDPADDVAFGFSAGATGSWFAGATFRFFVRAPAPQDAAFLRVDPLRGKPTSVFAPKWFPELMAHINMLKELKPRKAKRMQNRFIAKISSQYAVQVPLSAQQVELVVEGATGVHHYYDVSPTAAPSHLATWLTLKELLKTRQVEIRFAGAHFWYPGQFIAIARRPLGGPGARPTRFDILLVTEMPKPDAKVGAEAWTKTTAAYVGWVDTQTQEAFYDMPVGWGVIYEH